MTDELADVIHGAIGEYRIGSPTRIGDFIAAGYVVVPRDMLDNAAHRLAMSDFSVDRECGAELAAMLAVSPSAGKSEPSPSED